MKDMEIVIQNASIAFKDIPYLLAKPNAYGNVAKIVLHA
jgi:hypothetical protein